MSVIGYLGWFLLGALVVFVIAPKPKQDPPKLATLEDFDIPTAEEGRAITVLLGTREISGPNVVWFGHLRQEEIKK